MRRCILNLATKNAWFVQGQKRLRASLEKTGFAGDFLTWNDESEIGAPPHSAVPYAFKTFALNIAKDRGYDSALWLDASMWAIKAVDPIFEQIENEGHVFEMAGWSVGEWCTDAALERMGGDRDAAMRMPLFSAGFCGLNFRNDRSLEFLRQWNAMAQDGISFIGPWSNEDGRCSADKRVLGHRHDMTAGSYLAHRLEMKIQPSTFMAYDVAGVPKESICVLARGGA